MPAADVWAPALDVVCEPEPPADPDHALEIGGVAPCGCVDDDSSPNQTNIFSGDVGVDEEAADPDALDAAEADVDNVVDPDIVQLVDPDVHPSVVDPDVIPDVLQDCDPSEIDEEVDPDIEPDIA